MESAWRDSLRAAGVELLWYVPEDAFVARARSARLDQLRNLPFVRYVGPYRPEHKVHRALQGPGPGAGPGGAVPVAILMAPDATAAELTETRTRMNRVDRESHPPFGAVLRGRVTLAMVGKLAESPAVIWIEPGGEMKLHDEVASKIVGGDAVGHLTAVQQLGYDGRQVTVAVADTGLHSGDPGAMHPDLAGRVGDVLAYGGLLNGKDEHGHGTHVAGIIAGDADLETTDDQGHWYGLGVAPGAGIVVQRIFDSAGNDALPSSYEQLTRDAVEAGAEIGSNSWGKDTQGHYDLSAMEFDRLVRDADDQAAGEQPYLVVFSAGNAGPAPQTVASPAVAKNVIAVGASENNRANFANFSMGAEAMADFSSRGPSEDGRIKPDLVAPGTWIASLRSPFGSDQFAWLPIDEDYVFMGGTSQAAPQVAGAAAVFIQYYTALYPSAGRPSPALIKAALLCSATDMNDASGTSPTPNMAEGWGRVDLTQLIGNNAHSFEYIDQTNRLTNGQVFEHRFIINATNEPLKLILAYTDVPALPAALSALVNDLDLELVAPDGRLYRGNQFDQGASVPDAPGRDALNNVEGIVIRAPVPGEYVARVRAQSVVQDACTNTAPVDQDFALAICGLIPPPTTGLVVLDRTSYTAPGKITISVFDFDPGQSSAAVRVSSASETTGKTLFLPRDGTTNLYAGSIDTVTGPAGPTQIRIANGDWIRVEYFDRSLGQTNVAEAVGDLVAPTISGAHATNQLGQTVMIWQTFEPADSVIRYGTNPANLDQVISLSARTTEHELVLTNLNTGSAYYFVVTSTDAAGNTGTADNGGQPFWVAAAPTVLLVDDYHYDVQDVFIPLETYTNALVQLHVSFDVWSTEQQGDGPLYANLKDYPVVIWRINDSLHRSADAIAPAQRAAIQEYVNNGGAFFMASMEILSRLLDQGGADFVTNVLHVKRFTRNPDYSCTDCDENFQVPTVVGVTNDLVGDGILTTLSYDSYPTLDPLPYGPDFGDTFGPTTNATAFLVESLSGRSCGVRFPRTGEDGPGRVVFASFPVDAIPADAFPPADRASFLRRALEFLVPGYQGMATVSLNRGRYRVPDSMIIEVGEMDEVGELTVRLSSDSSPVPVSVTLHETSRHGLFRGSALLVSLANDLTNGQLRVKAGDAIIVRYTDEFGVVQTSAVVDTDPPVISLVTVVPGYSDATIGWTTDEPTDSLVQFGESIFLGRTAYSGELETNHSVTFQGLIPDRAYFFKIASRDLAGNVTVDDHNGQPHTFDTLGPELGHFTDNMDQLSDKWRVVREVGSQAQWTWGLPNNGLVVGGANGSDTAWATETNLETSIANHIDTSLISPAITLDGGNVAHLQFWHAYAFSTSNAAITELGTLLIVTNPLSPPIVLATYLNTNGGFQGYHQEDIDLTPFLGNAIFLIWRHQLDTFDFTYREGWALDDVCVNVGSVPPGIIRITNNLAQARATLSGPTTRVIQGFSGNFNDLPPGLYRLSWAPVPYYETPPAVTNALAENGELDFSGVYTFPDANHNGISDLWETNFFGSVTNHPGTWDTDHDGSTDYEEFVAGTDPTNASSALRLMTPLLLPGAGSVQVRWPTVPGRLYLLEHSSDLVTWTPLGGWTAANGSSSARNVPETNRAEGFRVRVQP